MSFYSNCVKGYFNPTIDISTLFEVNLIIYYLKFIKEAMEFERTNT